MTFRNFCTKNIFLPLSDIVTGNSTHKVLTLLSKSQFWTREELDNYQNGQLRKLIAHSYAHVPFYTELFNDLRLKPEEIHSKEDLTKLPIITKEDLKKAKGKFKATNIRSKDLIFRSSSGSTGEPFQFYKTKYAESFIFAAGIRGWNWMGYELGDKYVKISMNPRSLFIKKLQDKVNNCLYLSSNQLSPSDFTKIAQQIEQFDPIVIRCYPVPLMFLATQIKERKDEKKFKNLKAINTTGSTLSDKYRTYIEDTFKVKIFDSYSCEGGTNFSQCPSSSNYHPSEEYAISEFIADEFTKNDPRKPLRHITTDLVNYASPFIRYDTQDYLILGDDKPCNCHRNFINIKQILGRDSDIIKTPSGKYLIVENFVAYFQNIVEVEQIQIVQEEEDLINMKLIVNDRFDSATNEKITTFWTNYIGNDVKLNVQIVDNIELTPTGKRRTVIRNPKIRINDGY